MDAQTVRTALGTIQSNPSATEGWQDLSDALFDSAGDLDQAGGLSLLTAARERHAARGEYDAVARLLELSAKLFEDPADEARLLEEMATVFLDHLFAGNRAIGILARAVELAPDDTALQKKLGSWGKRAENFAEQAKTYLQEADAATDDEYRSAMLMRAAEVEVCFSENPAYSKIIENLELSLRLDSSNLPATKLLEIIYRRQADWDGVVRVLERASDRAPEKSARVASGIRLARLYLHHFDDVEKAAATYDRVLDSDPNQPDAIEFATQFYAEQERWNDLVRVYERSLKARKGEDKKMLGEMLQVAMLHWKKRGNLRDAEPWFDRIRKVEPANDGVLDFYREHKIALDDNAGLVQILEDALAGLSPDDERRTELEKEIESQKTQQAGAQKSIEQWKSTLREDPDDAEARAALKTLYKQTQGHNALVELLRQELERTPEEDFEKRLAVLREIAGVYRQYVKSDTALVGVLNQIVQLDGKLDEHDLDEVRELVSLYDKLSRPRDLLASQMLLAEIVPDSEEKVSLYRQVGRRWLDQFSNVQHAMEAFAALHAIDPKDPEAIERLEELYRKRRAWRELFSLYEQQLSRAQGEARVPLLREMAQLSAERLSKVDDALGFYREILEIDPTRTEVLDRMEKHAERSKNWLTLVDVLERRLQVMPNDEGRLPVLQKLGAVYGEQLDEPEQAIGTWRRVVEVHPGHPRAMRVLRDTYLKSSRFDELEDLYTSQRDLEGLAEVLSTAADRNKDPEEKLDLSFRAARVYEEGLGQSARAIRSYERILSIEPTNEKAIERLLPLYEQEEKWARIPPLYEVLLEVSTNPELKVGVYERLINIASSRLGDKRGAVLYARRAFEMAPEHPKTVELLDATARAAGDWNEMVQALESRLNNLGVALSEPPPSLHPEMPERASTAPAGGEAQSDTSEGSEPPAKGRKRRRRRRTAKKGATAEGGSSSPSDAPSAPPPVASSDAPGRPAHSVPAPALSEPYQRALALRLARVIGEELGRVDEAIGRLKVLAVDAPTDTDILSTLEALMRRESRVEDLRWLYEHRQKYCDAPQRKAEILCEWANYEEGVVQSQAEALRIYNLALEVQPSHVAALEAVARLALTQNQPERAAEVIAQHRELLSGIDAAHKDAMLAELLADRLDRPQDAMDAAKRALEGGAEPGTVIPVLQRLVEVPEVRAEAARILSEQYEAGGDSRQETDALRALISETKAAQEQIELYTKLADVYEQKLSEPGAALSVILEALRHHPAEIELWDRAGPLAGTAGRPTDLADAFREALREKLDDDLALDLARRAADIHEQILGDPQGAVPYYEKVLALQPDDEESFSRLKEILTAGERWRELEELYDREIQRLDDDARKIEMLSEVALLAEDIMGDSERAIVYHCRIVELEAENHVALESLDRLYTRLDRKKDLQPLLKLRAVLSVGEESHRHQVRLAQLSLTLHQPDEAIEPIERVLEEDPGNYEARDVAEELLQISRVRVRAAQALEHVYETKDEIRDLVRVLGVRVEALRPAAGEEADTSKEDERRDLLRRIATLRDDRLHDDEGSFDVFAELSPLDPVDSDLRERLIDSGRRLGRSEKVVEVLLACEKASEDSTLRAEILLQAAKVQIDLVDDPEAAEATFLRVLELREEEPEAALSAARSLEGLLVPAERHEEMAENLRLQIALEPDFDQKAELLARLAHLCSDVLSDNQAAITAWETRLSDAPDDAEALSNLTDLYERTGRFEDVARILEQRRDSTSDDQERINLARHLADVQERHLDAPTLAIESYQAILDEGGPDHEVLSALSRLYLRTERWEELADIYERQAEVLEDEVQRLSALAALGKLRAEKLEDVTGALDAYRRALAVDMNHSSSRECLAELLSHEDSQARLEAAEILHPIYEADGDNERLLHVLEVEAAASDDPTFRLERYENALRLAEDSLRDPTRALKFAALGARESASLGDAGSWLAALERLSGQTDSRSEQVSVLEAVVGELFDVDQQLAVRKRIAELKATELGDIPGAVVAYRKALEVQAEDRESLVALENLFAQEGDYGDLLEVLDTRASLAFSDEERKELLFRRAEIQQGAMEDTASAMATYESIVDVDLDPRAVSALEQLYTAAERYEDLITLIQRRIDEGSERSVDLRVQLASVAAFKQGEVERGLDELEQALNEDTQHGGALALLEQLCEKMDDRVLKARAASLLEPVYMVRADYDKVLHALSLRLEGSDALDERRDLVTRIAQIHEEQKEDYTAALEVTAQLLADDPADALTVEEMERLAKVAGTELRLGELLAAQVAAMDPEDEASASLCRRAGQIYAKNGRNEEALALLRQALAFEPDSPQLFQDIDALLREVGTAEERVELCEATLEHRYDPRDQLKLLHTIADLQENQLEDVEAAISAHQRALELDETHETTLVALTRLYEQAERWNELVELYERRADMAGPMEGAPLRILLADLHMRRLRAHEPALDQLEEIVRDRPDYQPAIERLEAMRASEGLRERVVDLLRPIYQEQDDWRKIILLNEDRFALADDSVDQVAILRETAELWELRGEDPVRAQRVLSAALELQPEDEEVRAEVERLAAITEDWQGLAALYAGILETHTEMLGRQEMVLRLARLHDEKLDDPRQALLRYQEARAVDETDGEIVDAALRLSLLLGDWTVLEQLLVVKADMVYDDIERSQFLFSLGALRQSTLGDADSAILAFERAFETDEQNMAVCDRLIELYEARGEPGRLVDLYIARVEGEGADDDHQFSLLTRAAELLETALSDNGRAIECLVQALAVRPGEVKTTTELNRLYRTEKMWPELLDNLRLEAGVAEDAEHRLRIRHDIARILAYEMESYEEALEAFAVILDEKPDDEEAIDAVFSLVEREEHMARQASDLLVPALRQTPLRSRLVKALTLRLSDEQEPHTRVETLRTIAQVQEEDLDDPAAAFETYLKAISETPDKTELYEELDRLARRTKDYARYAEALSERAPEVFDSEAAAFMWARLGEVREQHLAEKKKAIDAYQAACEQVGDRPEYLDALDRLYTDLDDTDEVVALLERRMALADDDQAQSRILCRQGQLLLDKQERPAEALEAFRSALERDVHNVEASESLSRLLSLEDYFEEAFDILDGVYRDRPSGKDLAELHQRRVEKAESPGERLDMRRGLAQVLEDECRDPEAALSVLQEGLFDDPADEGLRDEMERLLLVTGAWSRAAHAMLEVVSRLGEDLDKLVGRQMSERAGVWLRDRAGDADAAEQAFLRAFELDPESDDILEQLEALQLAPGKESRLFVTLRYRATMAVDEGSKIEFLKRCQELAQRLGDRDLSEQVLREILEADPEDKVALEDLTYLRKAAQDHAETFELLAKRVELESDPDKLRMLRLESAALARDELNRVDDAIDLLKTIFEEDPSDIDVAAQLRRAYESAERFDELGELIGRLMGSVSEPPQSLDLKLSLARLRRDQFDDLDRALLLFSEVFEADPRNKEAASDLRAAYEQTERFDDLAGLLIKQSEVAEVDGDVGIAVELLREVANIREEKQGDLEAAIRTWTKIREREDTLEVLESIYRLQLAAGNKRDAASSLEEICRSVDDRERRTRRGELSELYRSLGDQELLIRTIEGSVELWPGDAELRSLLRQEYETVGAWDKVAEMIVLDAGKATEVAEQVKLYREAAQIHSEKRSDMASAIPNLQKAAELSPDDRELQLELCDAYSASGRGAESIAVLEQIVQSYGGKRSKELGEIHRRLATAYLSENDAERALAELDRAFRIEPGNVNVLRQLGEVALQAGDLKKAQQMFRALLLQRLDGNSPITKAEVFCRLGQVHQQLGENPKAKQMFERALQADPSLEDAQTGLSSLK